MPNDLTANPWFVDTPATIWPGRVYIKDLIWNKPTVGATLIVTDINGNTVLNTVANTDAMFYFGNMGWITGLVVVTMSSGALSIFINK